MRFISSILLLAILLAATTQAFWFPFSRVGRSRQSRIFGGKNEPEIEDETVQRKEINEEEANQNLFMSIINTLAQHDQDKEKEEPRFEDQDYTLEPVVNPLPVVGNFQYPEVVHQLEKEEPMTYERKYAYERSPVAPRNVEGLAQFGPQMALNAAKSVASVPLPQLTFNKPQHSAMNFLGGVFRQQDIPQEGDNSLDDLLNSPDDKERCIPKVMQVEETVYDRAIKCHHSYQEKCHMTYITDYRSTTEQKCETTFKKNCHITFKPMPFNETVNVCHTPVVRECGDTPTGVEICSTHYETNCETKYKTYEVEQDEPVCTMEIMQKCQNITLPLWPEEDENAGEMGGDDNNSETRKSRQAEDEDSSSEEGSEDEDSDVSDSPTNVEEVDENDTPEGDNGGVAGVTIEQQCEDWPVQKCTLEKRMVKKVHPETACRKIPREVCIPNNCAMVPGEEICHDENRMLIQNVPQEECELQPEENCHMESVLVPRLVPQPNCVKVPKEICVNIKKNPRRVKKPVVKEWCYRPSDLKENPDSIPDGILSGGETEERSQIPPQRSDHHQRFYY